MSAVAPIASEGLSGLTQLTKGDEHACASVVRISVAFGFIAWGIVAAQYFWPLLRALARVDALRPLLLLHSFRFVGIAFLVEGVVAPELPAAFAVPAAYGDLIAAMLALLALAALHSAVGIPLVWVSTFGAVPIFSTPSIKPMLPA